MASYQSVLIVEDDDTIRETLHEIIAAAGYHPITARNGKEALDLLTNGRCKEPCLILLDWAMPLIDGEQFLKLRRATDVIASIPTIILSAAPPGKLPHGATKILVKPIELEHLLAHLSEYCGDSLKEELLESAIAVGKAKPAA